MIHCNLASAYFNQSQYKLAVERYLLAVKIDPEMASAHNGLAMAYYKLKEYNLAWEHIKIADKLGAEIDEKLLTAIKDRL